MTTGFDLQRYEIPRKERLNDKQIKELIKEYQTTKSEEKKEKIVKNSLYIVNALTKVCCKNKNNYEDDYQAGIMGLILAIERFDVDHGVQWNTFATSYIRGTIIREYQNRNKNKKKGISIHGLELEGKSMENLIQDEQDIEEEIIQREFAKEVAHDMKKALTAKELEAIEYIYGINGREKKTYKQLAAQLGKSQSTLRTQVEKGLKKIKKYMEGYDYEN